MVRGIPWVDLHLNHDENNNQNIDNSKKDPDTNVSIEVERNWEKDLMSIGRRTAFGVVVLLLYLTIYKSLCHYHHLLNIQCGSMTGAAFGTVDVLRDTKMMVSQVNVTNIINTFEIFNHCHFIRNLLQQQRY